MGKQQPHLPGRDLFVDFEMGGNLPGQAGLGAGCLGAQFSGARPLPLGISRPYSRRMWKTHPWS